MDGDRIKAKLPVQTHLKHLDEGNTQVEVSQVTADQTQTEHDTDRHNGTSALHKFTG